MAGMVEKKLQELGVVLADPTAPSANYVPFVRTGNLLMVSGQICYEGGKLVATGKLGAGVSVEQGQKAARACAINVLAQVKAAPAAAFYSAEMKEYFLPYEEVRKAVKPEQSLMQFLNSTYEAGANLAGWDRPTLERRAERSVALKRPEHA